MRILLTIYLREIKLVAISSMTILLLCGVPSSASAQNDPKSLLGDLTNYLIFIGDGRDKANWQGASKGFIGDVVIDGIVADETSNGGVPYSGTIYTNEPNLGNWQDIFDENTPPDVNPAQAFESTGNTGLITDLKAQLNSAFTKINALPVTSGYASVSSTWLDGLNTQNGISETFVINVTSGFSVSSQIEITGDADDVYCRWMVYN